MLGYQTVEELMEDGSKNSNPFYGDGKASGVIYYELTRKGELAIKKGKKISELTVENGGLKFVKEETLEKIAIERKLKGNVGLQNIINSKVIKELRREDCSENEREKEESKRIAQQIAEDKRLIVEIIKKYGCKPKRK